ncbi:putative Ig domain-containing protein [Dyella tabacisoli]|uniref:putative Ig domain-containing protein n=1 Tax=Dyella tabacisoli TaxID=2282381 RepID=UPI001CDCE80B|nr:putative Ig domain-containing protein [Dyella tabacisoli]
MVASIDAQGDVTTTSYDGVGNAIATRAYATALTLSQWTALGSSPTWAALQADLSVSANDRLTQTFYDADNRAVATVDAAGYVTVTTYDAAGDAVKTTAYATALTGAQQTALRNTPALSTLQADLSSTAQDQTTRSYYNSRGQVILQIDAAGYVTTKTYREIGMQPVSPAKQVLSTHYTQALTYAQLAALTGLEAATSIVSMVSAGTSMISLDNWDADGRLLRTYDIGYVTITSYTYDSVGHLLTTTAQPRLGGGAARTSASAYDAFGDVVSTLDGVGAANLTSGMTAAQQAAVFSQYGTTNTYNALGQRITSTDPLGNTTYAYYDASGRLAYTVQGQPGGSMLNAVGNVTAYTYNAFGQVATSRSFSSPLTLTTSGSSSGTTLNVTTATTAQLTTTAASLANPATDSSTSYTYTLNGQVASAVDGLGYQTAYQYDAFGDLLQKQQQLSAPGSALSAANSTITSDSYDLRGERIGEIDAFGTGVAHTKSSTFDAFGRVAQTIDSSSNTAVGYGYDTLGRQISVMQSVLGVVRTTFATYDAFGHVLTQTDAVGNVTSYQYDLANNKTTVITPDGMQIITVTDVFGDTLTVTDGANNTTTYTYDADGHLTQTQDALGNLSKNQYDLDGHLTQSTDATGHVITYSYDASGHVLTRTVDPTGLNLKTSYTYDGEGRTLSVTNPSGMVTTYSYDADGNVLTQVQDAGSGKLNLTTTYTYDGAGKTLIVNAGVGTAAAATTQYVYDNLERLSQQIVDPGAGRLNLTTSYTYDANNNLVTKTDAGGNVTSYVYGHANERTFTIDPSGAVTQTVYDADGRVTQTHSYATLLTASQLAALGHAPTLAALQPYLTVSSSDRITYTLYDANGHVAATIDASGYVITTIYDSAGRAAKTTAYATALTTAQMSALGTTPTLLAVQADLVTSAQDQTTRNYYDADNRVVARIDADGYLTVNSYNQATDTTTATRYATALTVTQLGALTGTENVVALVSLLGANTTSQQSSVTYNALGQVATSTAVDGTVTTYTYNGVGQLLNSTVTPVAGQGVARTISATYDALGDALTHTDAAEAVTSYAYNALGQRAKSTDALGNSTWYYYDAAGRLAYSIQGQPSSPTSSLNTVGNVTAYAYNAAGQLISTRQYASQLSLTTTATSTGTTLNVATATLAQVTAGVASLATSGNDANAVTVTTYTAGGQVATVTDGNGYQTAYQYDAFGDLVQTQRQLSQPGSALSAANSTSSQYIYDVRGERIRATDGFGGSVARSTSNIYDAFGRITSSIDGNGNAMAYTYDNLGRQVTSSQVVQGIGRTTQRSYDAFGNVLTQTDALGNITQYQYNAATHTATVTMPGNVTMTTVKDAFGDTVSVTDGMGNATAYTYDADGRLTQTHDALGNISKNQYDLDGHLTQSTDATGHVVTYSYDASGRVLTHTVDPGQLNLITTYAYDGEGRQLSVTDPMGSVSTYTYDADGHVLTQVQDAGTGKLNLTTIYTYDGAGKALTVTIGAGTSAARSTQYVYDALERLSQQIVDPAGLHLTTSYTYDSNNNLISVTDANGNATRSVYNEANELAFTVAGDGGVTQYWHDADGRRTQSMGYATALTGTQLTALGSSPTIAQMAALVTATSSDAFQQKAYDPEGRVIYELDGGAGLHVTQWTYDANGRVLATTRYQNLLSSAPAGGTSPTVASIAALVTPSAGDETTLTTYDADGRMRFSVQVTTVNGQPAGVVSEQRYDAAGRLIASLQYGTTIALSSSQSLTSQVSTSGLAQTLASAANHTTSSIYDNAGRLRYTIDTTNHVIETQYDADGRVLQQSAYANAITLPGTLTVAAVGAAVTAAGVSGARVNTTTYDAAGRVLTTGDALGTRATFAYDATGLQLGHADRDGNWTWMLYDKAGRKTLDQSPAVTVGSYDPVTWVFQTAANQYLYTTYAYDGVGNVLATNKGVGPDSAHVTTLSTTTYAYDALGHQTQATYPGGATAHVTYDAQGRVVMSQDGNGHYQYKAYASMGWEAYSIDADGYVTATGRDSIGNVTAVTRYATALNTAAISGWHAGQPLTVAQIQLGLVTSASDRTTTTTYDQRNQKTQVQQSAIAYVLSMGPLSGAAMAATQPTTTYTYDAYGNVTSTATLLQGANATGDSNATPAIWATTYTYYDALNRAVMTVTPTGAYTSPQGYVTTTAYNAFGNVTSITQYATAIATSGVTTAAAPALPPAGTVVTGYDRVTSYGYDAIGRKTSETDTGEYSYVNGTPAIAAGSSLTTWAYDGENRLTTATVNGATVSTTYDALGRVMSVTEPTRQALVSNWALLLTQNPSWDLTTGALYTNVAPVTSYAYDALGDVLSTKVSAGSSSVQTWSFYDVQGRQIKQLDGNGNQSTISYDNNGNIASKGFTLTTNGNDIAVTTTYTYDADNQRLTTAVQRGGQSGYDSYTQVQYNAFGEVTGRGDNNGIAAHYSYDNAGNLIGSPDARTGAAHSYGFDLAHHLLTDNSTVTGGSASTWTHNWVDLSGKVVQQRTPSDSASSGVNTSLLTARSYDRWGNLLILTDAAGNTTQYHYDSRNQLIGQVEPNVLVVSATGTRTWATPAKAWYYNVSGQLIGTTDENGNSSWNTYDGAGHLTVAQDNVGARTYTAYDALGRAVAQQMPPASTNTGAAAHIVVTGYDNLDQVTTQNDLVLNSTGTAYISGGSDNYLLNSNGDRIQVTDKLGNTTFYSYDSQHRVLRSATPLQQANSQAQTYAYDANGNRISQTDADGFQQSWVYDYFGRVQSHIDESGATYTYTYDASSGRLTQKTSNWAASGPSASVTSTQNFQYMADGQLAQLSETVGGVSSTFTYQYDANGNQTLQTANTQDGAGQAVATQTVVTYDSHNRLQEVTVENAAGTVASMRTVYNYDANGNRRAVLAQSAYGASGAAAPISLSTSAPVVGAALAAQTVQPLRSLNYSVPAGSFTDPLGMGLTYTLSGAVPSWLSFNATTLAFTGTPPSAAASYTFTVTATDALGRSVSSALTVTVPTVAPPAVATSLAAQTVQPGAAVSYTIPAGSFTDPLGLGLSYTATLAGGALPSWLSFNASTQTFTGTPPVSAQSYGITVTATDALGRTVSSALTISVPLVAPVFNGVPANQSVVCTNALSFTVPGATDPNGLPVTYNAAYYNGSVWTSLPSWLAFNASTLTFSGTPPIASVGNYTLAVGAQSPGSPSTGISFTLSVALPTAPVFSSAASNQSATYNTAMSFSVPGATNANGFPITYSASYYNGSTWTSLPSWLAFNANTLTFSGTPPASSVGTLTLAVGATDTGTSVSSAISFTLTVAALPPVYNGGIPANIAFAAGDTTTWTIPANTFSNPMGRPLTYQLNGFFPPGTSIDASGTITSSPPAAMAKQRFAGHIFATDPVDGQSVIVAFTLVVSPYIGAMVARPMVAAAAAPAPAPNVQADWFTYDADNRVIVNNGSLVNGVIGITNAIGSAQNGYDAAGNVTVYTVVNAAGVSSSQQNVYDARNELVRVQAPSSINGTMGLSETRSYDADGHLVSDVVYNASGHVGTGTYNGLPISFSDAGWVASDTVYTYNVDGQLTDQSQYVEDSAQDLITKYGTAVATSTYASQAGTAPGTLPTVGSNTNGVLLLNTEASYAPVTSGLGYDADGNLLGYRSIVSGNFGRTAYTNSYQTAYIRQNGALSASTSATSTNATFVPATDTSTYNALGELVQVNGNTNGAAVVRAMAYDPNGEILQQSTTSGGSTQSSVYAYAGGHALGNADQHGNINIQDTSSGFSNSNLGTQHYVVQAGDTLQSIAQIVYGNSNYGYILAQVNGLQSSSDLLPGTRLTISQVTTSNNNATTFKPYNPGEVIGSTTPTLAPASTSKAAAQFNAVSQLLTSAIEAVLHGKASAQTGGNGAQVKPQAFQGGHMRMMMEMQQGDGGGGGIDDGGGDGGFGGGGDGGGGGGGVDNNGGDGSNGGGDNPDPSSSPGQSSDPAPAPAPEPAPAPAPAPAPPVDLPPIEVPAPEPIIIEPPSIELPPIELPSIEPVTIVAPTPVQLPPIPNDLPSQQPVIVTATAPPLPEITIVPSDGIPNKLVIGPNTIVGQLTGGRSSNSSGGIAGSSWNPIYTGLSDGNIYQDYGNLESNGGGGSAGATPATTPTATPTTTPATASTPTPTNSTNTSSTLTSTSSSPSQPTNNPPANNGWENAGANNGDNVLLSGPLAGEWNSFSSPTYDSSTMTAAAALSDPNNSNLSAVNLDAVSVTPDALEQGWLQSEDTKALGYGSDNWGSKVASMFDDNRPVSQSNLPAKEGIAAWGPGVGPTDQFGRPFVGKGIVKLGTALSNVADSDGSAWKKLGQYATLMVGSPPNIEELWAANPYLTSKEPQWLQDHDTRIASPIGTIAELVSTYVLHASDQTNRNVLYSGALVDQGMQAIGGMREAQQNIQNLSSVQVSSYRTWGSVSSPYEVYAAGNVPVSVEAGSSTSLPETVFRGERSSVTPDDVFANGISSKGSNLDLLAHTSANQGDSGFVATSPQFNIAQEFAGRNGYIYDIFPKGGVDVNATLGASSPFPEQFEIAMPGGISPGNIRGAYPLRQGQLTGEYIENPSFGK